MSDHALLGWMLVFMLVVAVTGFAWMFVMLREAQRLTRVVAAMVYQESDQIRALMTGRSPLDG